MDRESLERLRFDRRLLRRRDWVEAEKFDDHLEALPDVSEKMTTAAELEAEETAAAEAAPPVEEPAAPAPPAFGSFGAPAAPSTSEPEAREPVPVAGDFGAPTNLGGGSFGNDSNGGNLN